MKLVRHEIVSEVNQSLYYSDFVRCALKNLPQDVFENIEEIVGTQVYNEIYQKIKLQLQKDMFIMHVTVK